MHKPAFYLGFMRRAAWHMEKTASEWAHRFKNKQLSEQALRQLDMSDEAIQQYRQIPPLSNLAASTVAELEAQPVPFDPWLKRHGLEQSTRHNNMAYGDAVRDAQRRQYPVGTEFYGVRRNLRDASLNTALKDSQNTQHGLWSEPLTYRGNEPTQVVEKPQPAGGGVDALLKRLNSKPWSSLGGNGTYQPGTVGGPTVTVEPGDTVYHKGIRAHEFGHDTVARMPDAQRASTSRVLTKAIVNKFPEVWPSIKGDTLQSEMMAHWSATNPKYTGAAEATSLPLAFSKGEALAAHVKNQRLAATVAHLHRNYGEAFNLPDGPLEAPRPSREELFKEQLFKRMVKPNQSSTAGVTPDSVVNNVAPVTKAPSSIVPSAVNLAKGVGKGLGAGIPISMGLDAVAPTTMSTPGQQQQHPVASYFNDAAGHMLDSTKAITGGAATGAAISGGVGAIPGAIAGGVGDLVHKGWNAVTDIKDIAGNLGGAALGNIRASGMENKLKPIGSNSTIIPPLGNSMHNAPTAGGLIKGSADHHSVYCVKLDWDRMNQKRLLRQNPDRDSSKPAVYVGSTGLDPQERFKKHKDGLKQNNLVKQFGVELMPELYQQYNPMRFRKAEEVEKWLAAKLRADGYTVAGGNEKTSGERINELATTLDKGGIRKMLR